MEPQVADSFSPEFQDCCLALNIEPQHLSWGLSCLTILCSLGFNKGSVRKISDLVEIAYMAKICLSGHLVVTEKQ